MYSQDQLTAAFKLRGKGWPTSAISKNLKVPHRTVDRWLKGVPPGTKAHHLWKFRPWTPEEDQKIRECWGKVLMSEVAKVLGRSKMACDQRGCRLGLPHRPKRNAGKSRYAALRRARKVLPKKCMVCGYDKFVDWHHIIPRKEGGTHDVRNTIMLCPNHHREADQGLISKKTLLSITVKYLAQMAK